MSTGIINPEDIATLRSRVPIEDIIGEYVTLKRAGVNLTGLCPFHDESTPSFSVSPDRGLFHCFGCQESGDAITFLRKVDDLSFVEAVQKIAAKAGFELRYVEGSAETQASTSLKRRLIDANMKAAEIYRQELLHNSAAASGITYLKERNFTDEDIDKYGIGYSPDEWTFLVDKLTQSGFTSQELVQAGLATEGKNGKFFDRFRNRLMWPIYSASGEIIGFGARRLTDDKSEAKWLNTSETPLYKKSEVLYGIHLARKPIAADKKVIIVEGYGDVMACHLAGLPHTVAASGTSFGDGHIKIIKRLFRDDDYRGKIIFTFDGDEAGLNAARRAFSIINKVAAQTLVAVAPDGMDPLDLRNAKGDKALHELVDNAVPLIEFVINHAVSQFNLKLPEDRLAAAHAAAGFLSEIKDIALRDLYVRKTAGWVGLPESSILSILQTSNQKTNYPSSASTRTNNNTDTDGQNTAVPLPDKNNPRLWDQRELLKLLLQAETVPHVDLYPGTFSNPVYQKLFSAWYELELGTSEPYRQMQERLPAEYLSALNALVVESPLIAGEAQTNLSSLANRILASHLEEKKSELKAEMSTSTPERAAELIGEISTVDKVIRDLKHNG